MKKILRYLLVITTFLVVHTTTTNAQYVLLEANKAFDQYNFDKAIDLYEQAYQKKQTLHAAERLATCYSLQSNYKETESWAAIAASSDKATPAHILAYAKALQTNAKFSEAKVQYQKYKALNTKADIKQLDLWIASCDTATVWMQNPTRAIISNLKNLNTPQSDWGLATYGNQFTFTSDRKITSQQKSGNKSFLKFDGAKTPSTKTFGWTGNGYLKIYGINNLTDSVAPFPINTQTDYHVGAPSFNRKADEMYFTITRIPEKLNYANGKQATVNVEIYSSKKDENGVWSAPIAFQYNNANEYTVGDPFFTADGKRLYFASNMPGGQGGSDIYFSEKTTDGNWSKPVNLTDINTAGNERTPFLDDKDVFYFSTDGRIGMGGLDIFTSKFLGNKISTPKNLGYPTNSPQDDFAYIKTGELAGFLSSNRNGGVGSDDIYSFAEQLLITYKLDGTVYDKTTNKPLISALVTLAKNGEAGFQVQTDALGNYKFDLEKETKYTLTGEKTNFRSDATFLSTIGNSNTKLKYDLFLEPIIINKAIKLENIYYDLDKANIRPDAAIELDKLVKIMKENPTIWIELGSHTDSRANDKYNQALSQKRANSAVQYIVDRGISRNRIVAMGYGESKLLNRCANGIDCTPEEHQLNRRTEFKITKQ